MTKSDLKNIVKRCITGTSTPNSGLFPSLKVIYHEKETVAEHLTPYGLCSHPPANSIGLVLTIAEQEENLVAIVNSPIGRDKNLADGEISIYHPASKSRIHLKANGDIEINAKESTGTINIIGGAVNITDASAVVEALVKHPALKTYLDGHVHTGVSSGSDNSGPPSSPVPASVATTILKAT